MVFIYFTVHSFPSSTFSLPCYNVFLYVYPTHLSFTSLIVPVISSTPAPAIISYVLIFSILLIPSIYLNIIIPVISNIILFSLPEYSVAHTRTCVSCCVPNNRLKYSVNFSPQLNVYSSSFPRNLLGRQWLSSKSVIYTRNSSPYVGDMLGTH